MPTAGDVYITLRVHRSGVVIGSVTGDVDWLGAPTLGRFLAKRIAAREDFVLDLRGLGFLGAAGLATLLEAAGAAAEENVSWAMVTWGPVVNRVIVAIGVSTVLPTHPTLCEALADVQAGRKRLDRAPARTARRALFASSGWRPPPA
ncbi:STAS domain-containing protein [Amycolatopsis sp. YIM 10]|uniref:STAS domain-containing protein n=1 Tax=Amycolatopsis sp. YIM 10 TaxID=2653857 RepID=UPI0012A9EDEB|nr:STAS domain-containing protein [Amycolatopsis sp. YIM 10]QFU87228.1 Anti-sigma-F factor antagonist RsfA [Amycolatopsis sp. YIM 10]